MVRFAGLLLCICAGAASGQPVARTSVSPNDIGYRLGSIEARIENIGRQVDSISKKTDEVSNAVDGIRKEIAEQKASISLIGDRASTLWAALAFIIVGGFGFIGKQLTDRNRNTAATADSALTEYRIRQLYRQHPEIQNDPNFRESIDAFEARRGTREPTLR